MWTGNFPPEEPDMVVTSPAVVTPSFAGVAVVVGAEDDGAGVAVPVAFWVVVQPANAADTTIRNTTNSIDNIFFDMNNPSTYTVMYDNTYER
jgi:hypothetical protein